MSNFRTLIVITSSLVVFSVKQVYALPLYIPFEDRVQMSDLIVEGIVKEQTDNPDYERGDINSYMKSSLLKVTKIFKGNISVGDKITVFSRMNFACDTSDKIAEGKLFLLMLKKHESGYSDVNTGNGIWEIVTLKPDQQFVIGACLYGAWAQSYEKFIQDLEWTLSERRVWPEKPAVSLEKARKIAEDTFSKMNIDLKEFNLTKYNFQNANNNIIGVAYSADPIWYLKWEKNKVKEQKETNKSISIYCWIHAHTGNIRTSEFRPEIVSAKTSCSLFLKTNRVLSDIYAKFADDISVTQLTEDGFDKLYSKSKDVYLRAKPSYPDGTTFWRIDFPDYDNVEPLLTVLDRSHCIRYVGTIDSEI